MKIFLLILSLFIGMKLNASSADLEKILNDIIAAESKKLPRTALDLSKSLEKKARAENNKGMYIRAMTKRILNETHIRGKMPKDKIRILKEEIAKVEAADRPLVKIILARWYWHYFEQNRYKFSARTQTSGLANDDFTTWDLPKIFSEIRSLFEEGLKDADKLKKMSVSLYQGVIEPGNLFPGKPLSVYEFAVREMINFLTQGISALPAPVDKFEIEISSEAFGQHLKFLSYKPSTTDKESSLLRTIELYQDLLKFYKNEKQLEQYVDTDINRLKFIHSQLPGADATDIFIKRLKEIEQEFSAVPTSTLASFELAKEYQKTEDFLEAVNICQKAIDKFPKSDGAIFCQNLINEIKAPSFSMKTENSINKSNSIAFIKYNNVSKIYFRIVEDDWQSRIEQKGGGLDEGINEDEIIKLLSKKAVKEWSVDLEETTDFKEREVELNVAEVPYGFYRIFASSSPVFSASGNGGKEQLAYSSFWRTDTLLLTKSQAKGISGFVLDARNGEPLEKRQVTVYKPVWNTSSRERLNEKVATLVTDKFGAFQYDSDNNVYYFAVESKNTGNTFSPHGSYRNYRNTKQGRTQAALVLTDRSIYRPDQRIHFKVICYFYNQAEEKYEIYQCKNVEVAFFDANNKEVAKVVKSANDFGSFSGDFIAPKNTLGGVMSLRTNAPYGNASIHVEEYKRPKFEVTLDPPTKQFRLDEEVTINGKAQSYSGAPLIAAKVKYRVVRGVELPHWWHWGNPYQAEQEISSGVTRTNDSGEFSVLFKARANKSVDPKMNPVFRYRVLVDVIDPTGETRSGNMSTSVGHVSLQAQMKVADWLPDDQLVSIGISTNTLDGKSQNSEGLVEIYELNGPKNPVRASSNENYFFYWYKRFFMGGSAQVLKKDMSKIESWDQGSKVASAKFEAKNGTTDSSFKLKEGAYVALLKIQDQFKNGIEEKIYFVVFGQKTKTFKTKIPSFFKIKKTALSVGETLEAVWASGYDKGLVHVDLIQNGNILKQYWTKNGSAFHEIKFPITENLKGGFSLQLIFVHDNQLYAYNQFIEVLRPENALKISVEKMKSKLRPGEKDSWTLKVQNFKDHAIAAEMVATMFDASLETFVPHSFQTFSGFWRDQLDANYSSTLLMKDFYVHHSWMRPYDHLPRNYPSFNPDILEQFSYLWPYVNFRYMQKGGSFGAMESMMDGAAMPMSVSEKMDVSEAKSNSSGRSLAPGAAPLETRAQLVLKKEEKQPVVNVRKNLNELAFFYPHLLTDNSGKVSFEFSMPEALTRWKFRSMAHGKKIESGYFDSEVVTQQELMVTPNPPRFLRQGDKLYFSAKVDNLSDVNQSGEVRLELTNALNDSIVVKEFISADNKFKFSIPAKKSASFSWELKVPDVTYPIIYKIKAIGEKFTDGEEGMIPVLSRKIFVQESIPLWISGIGEKTFKFDKLLKSEKSTTLKSDKLVLQMVSNPAWYAVQAIPYLQKDFPECTDYVFERLYANSLGEKIIDLNPGIEKVFNLWKGTDALKSNLQKNTDLKKLPLEETPWLANAESEEKAKNDIGKFFEKNNLHTELSAAYKELEARMISNGGWPWIPGGPIDYSTTLYITTGFGKLQKLGVKVKMDLAHKSIAVLDQWIKESYDKIVHKEKNHYSHMIAYYLYGRSFFLTEVPVSSTNKVAVDYFIDQAKKYWTKLDSRLSEAHTAIAATRFGSKDITDAIVKSLRERALHSAEMGMYWGDEEWGYWWYQAPIETQSRIIELFSEVLKSEKEIDQMNIWLLKQKQTQDWKTSRATADVVYTLLNSGSNLLAPKKNVKVSLGKELIRPEKVEAGTGFYEKRFSTNQIKASMGEVKLSKEDKGIAWGGLHWHYFEDIKNITPHKSPLSLVKKLWVKRDTKKGPTLFPISAEKLSSGETLVVRVELHVDRDMEYVHLKDMRGSGTEPVNVLSSWKYQDGLAYYESTRDTATHFFFAYLPKGDYVFEYELKIFHRGEFQSGIAEIQSLYAPEFSSHSESINLKID